MATTSVYPFYMKAEMTPGAQVIETEPGVWRLSAPPVQSAYRLAQLDDYHHLRRRDFSWTAPALLALRLRASAQNLPGTWGFGLWNDPFGMGILLAERRIRLPALPNSAWFFHASPPNYLTLDESHPAQGWTAGVFRSPRIPSALMLLGAPGLALLAIRPLARILRSGASRFVRQAGALLNVDVRQWHSYRLDWQPERVCFFVDNLIVLEAPFSPYGPLGAVIWIDNQYMRFTPDGRLGFGALDAPEPGWIEIAEVEFHKGAGNNSQR